MKINLDYKHWLETKRDLINELKESETLIFDRIEPVYNTLEYYKEKELSDQEYNIFDVGYMYLSEQILGIENYIKTLGSLTELENQSVTYNYLMDINDFYEDHDLEHDKPQFLKLIGKVEDLLLSKQPLEESVYEMIQESIEKYKDSSSIVEIFVEISDNLGV